METESDNEEKTPTPVKQERGRSTTPKKNGKKDDGDDVKKMEVDSDDEGDADNDKTATTTTPTKQKSPKTHVDNDDLYYVGEYSKKMNDTERKKKCSMEHTVILEGLAKDVNEKGIKAFFTSNKIKNILEIHLSRWNRNGRLRGYGHVVFDSVDTVKKALKLSKKKTAIFTNIKTCVDNKTPETPADQPTDCKTIFVKNLPYHVSNPEVRNAFNKGKVASVKIARNRQTHMCRGFAHVEFKTPKDAKAAVSDRSIKIHGRSVCCNYDVGPADGHQCTAPKDGVEDIATTPTSSSKRKRNEKNAGDKKPKVSSD